MKKSLLVFCTSFISISSIAQIQSNCEAPEDFQALYKKDVEYLALARLYEIQSPDTNVIIVPQAYQDTIMEGLAAIYNTGNQLQADSVFDWYCLHNTMPSDHLQSGQRPNSSFIDAKVYQDYNLTWTTNFDIIDLSDRYSFEIGVGCCPSSNYQYNWGWAHFASSRIVNINVFKDSLVALNPMIYFRDFSDVIMMVDNIIDFKRNGDTLRYTFTLGWGDCPLGCTSFKSWYYTVYPDCMVALDSTRQHVEDLWPKGCKPTAIKEAEEGKLEFNVFPNPAITIVNVKVPSSLSEKYDYKLYSSNGEVLLSGSFLNNVQLNLASLSKGIYLLQILNKAGNMGMRKVLLQ